MLKLLDRFLDSITMYRLLLYYLMGLLLVAMVLGQFGQLIYSPFSILVTALVLLVACWVANKMFAVILDVPTNYESSLITALILALIITPLRGGEGLSFLLAASGLAMASKYLLTIKNKHLFNPAAIAVTLTALGPQQSASWWVGTQAMLPFVVVGGVLLVRKIRRTAMVTAFLGSALATSLLYGWLNDGNPTSVVKQLVLSSSLFFLAFVMLTEPLTSPPTRKKQIWYGLLVGVLFPPQMHFLKLYSTPERALIAGNIFAYFVSPKQKLLPKLKQVVKLTPSSLDFIFDPGQRLAFEPGQYMEFTLPHDGTDSRGNRRYFTIASSPTEEDLHVGVKFVKEGSSFKRALLKMTPETPLVAAQVAGDFTLPKNPAEKLVFIAGGIGVTPFRSMMKYLIDTNDRRDVMMLYSARNAGELAYRDVFETARQQLGIDTVYMLTDENTPLPDNKCYAGYINAELIQGGITDYRERTFYISGTHQMVEAIRHTLTGLGVPASQIKIDFFPGYA